MGILRFWDFALTRFANVTGATLPRRQQVDIIGFEGEDSPTLNRILLRVTASDSLYSTNLAARPGQFDGERVTTVGFATAGDDGSASFRYYQGAAYRTSANGVTRINTTDGLGQYRMIEPPYGITPKQCGVVDSVRNDTAWNLWLSAVCTGTTKKGYVSAGDYLIGRVNAADNITANGVTIELAQGASLRYDTTAGTPSSPTQNAFQATGKSNLRFVGGQFLAITFVSLTSCSDVTISGVSGDGTITSGAHAGYFFPYAMNFYACSRVRISGCNLGNFEFYVFLDGVVGSRCQDFTVSGCSLYATGVTARPGNDFPVGVYVFHGDDVSITGNNFRNIKSAVSGGNRGTGMGFAIYEGDGHCASLTVGGNTFVCSGGDGYGMTGVYVTTVKNLDLQPGTYRWDSVNASSVPVAADFLGKDATAAGAQRIKFNAGAITMTGGTSRYALQAGTSDNSSYPLSVTISGVNANGGRIQWVKSNTRNVALTIDNNDTYGSPDAGIEVIGDIINVEPSITNNRIEAAYYSGISISGSVRSMVIGNRILDCNQANEAVDDGKYCGIVFPSYGYGATIKGNHIANRTGFGGNIKRGIHAFSSTQRFAFKYDSSNTSSGLPANVPTMYQYFYSAAPTGGWDWRVGDQAFNASTAAAGNPGWTCTQRIETTLGAIFNSGTTVTVASTASMAGGDVFQVIISSSTIDSDAGNGLTHYYGEVLSITDATHLELTAALPASYSFPNGAPVAVLRWKAHAAVAA